jgi:hypothetical protein
MNYLSPQMQHAGTASELIQFKGSQGVDGTLPVRADALNALLETE